MTENKIPHVIHYFWFGKAQKPPLIRKCIASWYQYHPDWEIKEWNETNYDVNKIPYIREAYQQKKWAFVVDYARFDILNQYGGVSLDTDVEFLRPIPETLLDQEAFTGFETNDSVAPGLLYASIPGQSVVQKMVNAYEKTVFGGTSVTVCDILTGILKASGLKSNNTAQTIDGVLILPNEYFCCFDHETQHFNITQNTVSIHHYAASWSPWYRKMRFRAIGLLAGLMGPERYKRIKHAILKRSKT